MPTITFSICFDGVGDTALEYVPLGFENPVKSPKSLSFTIPLPPKLDTKHLGLFPFQREGHKIHLRPSLSSQERDSLISEEVNDEKAPKPKTFLCLW